MAQAIWFTCLGPPQKNYLLEEEDSVFRGVVNKLTKSPQWVRLEVSR